MKTFSNKIVSGVAVGVLIFCGIVSGTTKAVIASAIPGGGGVIDSVGVEPLNLEDDTTTNAADGSEDGGMTTSTADGVTNYVGGGVFNPEDGTMTSTADGSESGATTSATDGSERGNATHSAAGSGETTTVTLVNPLDTDDFTELVTNFLQWLLGIAGGVALLMLIYGGVVYISSTGDQQKMESGKRIVTWTIFGLIIILVSFSILLEVEEIFVN